MLMDKIKISLFILLVALSPHMVSAEGMDVASVSTVDNITLAANAIPSPVTVPVLNLNRGYLEEAEIVIGPGAWLTNHARGIYYDGDTECETTEFVKIIAPPTNATVLDGAWYTADGTKIGPVIWGDFAIIQQKLDDPCGGYGGDTNYKSPDHAGLGGW